MEYASTALTKEAQQPQTPGKTSMHAHTNYIIYLYSMDDTWLMNTKGYLQLPVADMMPDLWTRVAVGIKGNMLSFFNDIFDKRNRS